jgi:hypothetical protein
LDKGAEEPLLDPKRLADMESKLLASADKQTSPEETRSEDNFSKLDNNTLKTVPVFECTYHDGQPPIVWKIWGENEYIEFDEITKR